MGRTLIPSLPRRAWQVLAGVALAAVALGLTVPFLVLYLHEARGFSLALAGVAMACIPLAAIVLNLLAGPLVDRAGPRRVLIAMLLVGSAGAVAMALVTQPWQAPLAACVFGAGTTTAWVGVQPLLATIVPSEQRADAFAVQFALLNAGIGAGGLAAGFVLDFGRPATFQLVLLAAAGCFLGFAAIVGLLEEGEQTAGPRPRRGEGYGAVVRDRAFRRLWVLNALLVLVGTSQLENAFPAFAAEEGASPRVLGAAFAVNTAAIVAGQFFVLRWVRGRRRTRGIVAQAGFWSAAWLLVLLGGQLDAVALFVVAPLLFACGEMLHSPIVPAIVNELAPEELRGRYNAAAASSWQGGRITGSVLAGAVLGAGLGGPLIVAFVGGCGLAALLALSLERRLSPAANGVVCAEERADARAIPSAHARPAAPGDPA